MIEMHARGDGNVAGLRRWGRQRWRCRRGYGKKNSHDLIVYFCRLPFAKEAR